MPVILLAIVSATFYIGDDCNPKSAGMCVPFCSLQILQLVMAGECFDQEYARFPLTAWPVVPRVHLQPRRLRAKPIGGKGDHPKSNRSARECWRTRGLCPSEKSRPEA